MAKDRSVRSSQLISPFGPGAIVDIGDESLLMTDISGWPANLADVKLSRLANELGVSSLKSPPKKKDRGETPPYESVHTIRFPRWMFCQQCRRMENWNSDTGASEDGKPVCRRVNCNKRALVPMRFVMACINGHMDDVPWDYWAHSGSGTDRTCDNRRGKLFFRSKPERGSGLDALIVECGNCSSSRDLGDISSPSEFQKLGIQCTARQPWESMDRGSCDVKPITLQRGASNLYYPVVRSALDIPVEAAFAAKGGLLEAVSGHQYFETCQSLVAQENMAAALPLADMIAADNNCTQEEVIAALSGDGEGASKIRRVPTEESLKAAEWEVLSSNKIEDFKSKNFVARVEDQLAMHDRWGLSALLDRVVLLDKLREVRAFCGYERVVAGAELMPPAGRHNEIKWLPAIEVFGEGIFLQFSRSAITQWKNESSEFAHARLESIAQRYREKEVSYLPEPTLELLALHTLAHLLIRQLSFECGYSSGSIRERIYAEGDQAGLLIYTADSDSEGSLGGLVQQGEPARLLPAIAAALDVASWCSNDPVCSEMQTQGVMGLNKAACHSCTLVSETSCTMNNLMLDRKLLIGDDNGKGLFTDVLDNIRSDDGSSAA